MKDLKNYTDSNGFIYHHDDPKSGSGFGDSAQRTFMQQLSLAARKEPCLDIEILWKLIDFDLEPRRHWDDNYWPGKPGFMSRDNLIPAICMLTLINSNFVYKILIQILIRFGFLWNTKKIGQKDEKKKLPDWCGPMVWFIALKWTSAASSYMKLILWFHLRKVKKDPEDTSDDLNIQVILMTLWLLDKNKIKAQLEYYINNRPKILSLGQFDPNKGFVQAFIQYFKSDIAPPLDVEWTKSIQTQWKEFL